MIERSLAASTKTMKAEGSHETGGVWLDGHLRQWRCTDAGWYQGKISPPSGTDGVAADWGRTLEALWSFNILEYLLNVVHSYLSKRELVLETSVGPRTYEVTAGFGTRCMSEF